MEYMGIYLHWESAKVSCLVQLQNQKGYCYCNNPEPENKIGVSA